MATFLQFNCKVARPFKFSIILETSDLIPNTVKNQIVELLSSTFSRTNLKFDSLISLKGINEILIPFNVSVIASIQVEEVITSNRTELTAIPAKNTVHFNKNDYKAWDSSGLILGAQASLTPWGSLSSVATAGDFIFCTSNKVFNTAIDIISSYEVVPSRSSTATC